MLLPHLIQDVDLVTPVLVATRAPVSVALDDIGAVRHRRNVHGEALEVVHTRMSFWFSFGRIFRPDMLARNNFGF